MISKSVLTIKFGLAKIKYRQAEANMYYPVCMIIDLQLSITAILIHNATLLSCHFRKIATVSHFRLVL